MNQQNQLLLGSGALAQQPQTFEPLSAHLQQQFPQIRSAQQYQQQPQQIPQQFVLQQVSAQGEPMSIFQGENAQASAAARRNPGQNDSFNNGGNHFLYTAIPGEQSAADNAQWNLNSR